MRLTTLIFTLFFLGSVISQECCFDNLGGMPNEGRGYTQVGNIWLNARNQIVLTDPNLVQDQDTSVLLDVSVSVWGEQVCSTLIDCGAFDPLVDRLDLFVDVMAYNVRTQESVLFRANHIPGNANRGVFFGCVNTTATLGVTPLENAIYGQFGDELRIIYQPVVGDPCYFPVWPSCKATEHWSYGEITYLMADDVIRRQVRKLQNLKNKVQYLKNRLFTEEAPTCEDWARHVVDLSPLALSSFAFLEALNVRNINADGFLDFVLQQNMMVGPGTADK